MPSKKASSYIAPGIFLALMLLVFILGVWMIYERADNWHQNGFNAAAEALPAFDMDAARKDAAKELGIAWPPRSPKEPFDDVLKKNVPVFNQMYKDGKTMQEVKAKEAKLLIDAGYAKTADGAGWASQEELVKWHASAKHSEYIKKREQELEALRKKYSMGGIFKIEVPKPESN